jgi:cell wall assembly regulator SMI1
MDATTSCAAGPSHRRRQVLKTAALVGLMPQLATARDLAAGPLAELDRWLAQHLPAVAASLNPGATDAQLDHLASVIGVPLPEDYRALYKWHNGQKDVDKLFTGPWYGLGFPSLDQVEQILAFWMPYADDQWSELNELVVSVEPDVVKPLYANRRWVPFAQAGNNYLGIDLDPDVRGVRGQVINFGRDEDLKRVVARNVAAFVQWFVSQLHAGNFNIRQERGGVRSFNTLKPPSRHFLDAIETLFRAPGER